MSASKTRRTLPAGLEAAITCLLALLSSSAVQARPRLAVEKPPANVEALARELQAEMVAIPAGTFHMGSDGPTAAPDERPVRTVQLQAFRLARFDLTAAQYALFARATGRPVPADPGADPTVNVSWDDAQAFIVWLEAGSGLKFRLPSEAEWEYAARAGTSTDYWWGDRYSGDYANGTGVKGRDVWQGLAPVGRFPANRFGLYDMIGNVWQWVQDCYAPSYAGAPTDGSAATGKPDCGRVLRGGSWCDTPGWMRSSTRNWFDTGERFDYIGVRLAQDEALARTRHHGS